MPVGSLFSGIGGFDLAASRVWGWDCVRWQVEIDPWARRVLAKHWPEVRRYADIREVEAGELEPVELVCIGFPCQDISGLGKRAGLAGERSGLWGASVKVVRAVRPRLVVVENVAALLSPIEAGPAPIAGVLGDLALLGFDALWDVRPACSVGAAHPRERVFIVAYPRGSGLEGRWPSGAIGNGARWTASPRVCRGADGLPYRVERTRGLGNAIVPQVAEQLFRWINEADTTDGS